MASGAGVLLDAAHATEPVAQLPVARLGRRIIDEPVEDLVVARATDLEQVADGLLLGAGVLPPPALEVKDRPVAIAERV